MTTPLVSLSLARTIYRRAMAPLAGYKLQRMFEDGLPRTFQRPLGFLFDQELSHAEQQAVNIVESIRAALACQTRSFEVVYSDRQDSRRTASQIAYRSSVTPEWGTFLYLCSQSFRSRTILELGSCAGVSGCYLASSKHWKRFITVEGSPALASLTRSNIGRISNNVEVINALFDDALDEILPTLGGGIDLAYIDGHHEYAGTLHYFRRLAPHLNQGGLVVFDDVHWSKGMWRAWQVLKEQEGFGYTIDVGRFGICLWDGFSSRPINYNLCPYLGWLRTVSA